MRKSDIPAVIVTSLIDPLVEIRVFGWGRVVACEQEGRYAIVVQEHGSPQHTLYEYDDVHEFHTDVRRVVRFGNDGDAPPDGGVLAPVAPEPPARTAGAEEPIPTDEEPETEAKV